MISHYLHVKQIILYEVDVVVSMSCTSSKHADIRDKSFGRVKTRMTEKYQYRDTLRVMPGEVVAHASGSSR